MGFHKWNDLKSEMSPERRSRIDEAVSHALADVIVFDSNGNEHRFASYAKAENYIRECGGTWRIGFSLEKKAIVLDRLMQENPALKEYIDKLLKSE